MKPSEFVTSSDLAINSRFIRQSAATNWNELSWHVKDEIVDLWHHPQVVQNSLEQGASQTTLQLLLDPHLLNTRLDERANRCILDLCLWLRSNGVYYELGFSPQLQNTDKRNVAYKHQIYLEIQ